MSKQDIYGSDPEGGAESIANLGLKCMKSNQSPASGTEKKSDAVSQSEIDSITKGGKT